MMWKHWFSFSLFCFALSARATPTVADAKLAPADLAIVLSPEVGAPHIPFSPNLMLPTWQNRLAQGFVPTVVGGSFFAESPADTWRLVSIRFAPCQPLIPYATPLNNEFCFPQLRLVWQPITSDRDDVSYFADDRAIHALYEIDPGVVLSHEDAQKWQSLRDQRLSLSQGQRQTFRALTQKLQAGLSARVLNLRGLADNSAYQDIRVRPEFVRLASAQQFLSRLNDFLSKIATPSRLRELTAFSLPEGRSPQMLNQWVFIAFNPAENGQDLEQKRLTLHSAKDGRLLYDYGFSIFARVRLDSETIGDDFSKLAPSDQAEIKETVILDYEDRKRLAPRIINPELTHVTHTSCASCHKLTRPPFNFHNLSFLENRPITVSPRVIGDVERELKWLSSLGEHK